MNLVIPFIPILSIILFLMIIKIRPIYAYIFSFILTIFLSKVFYKLSWIQMFSATIDGSIFAIWNMCILIFASFLLFDLFIGDKEDLELLFNYNQENNETTILLIVFGLGSLLEAFIGFGMSLIIPLSIMISLGLDKIKSTKVCLIAMTIPTSFGSMGLPQKNLSEITKLPIEELSKTTLAMEFIFLLILPYLIISTFNGKLKPKEITLKQLVVISLLYATSFSLGGILIDVSFPNIFGGLSIIISIYFINRKKGKNIKFEWKKYKQLVLVLIILCFPLLFRPVSKILSKISISLSPYIGQNPDIITLYPFQSPGILILIGILISSFIYKLDFHKILRTAKNTLQSNWKTFISICLVLSISKLMKYSSMTEEIATTLISLTSSYFSLISPLLGALGSIITGSNSSSNILFGPIQTTAAINLGFKEVLFASANALGAAIGKMVSPQNMILCSSVSKDLIFSKFKSNILVFCIFIMIAALLCFIFC